MSDSIFGVAQLGQCHPQIHMGINIIGIEPQRVLVLTDGFLRLASLPQSEPQIEAPIGIIGLDSESILEYPDSFRHPALCSKHRRHRTAHMRVVPDAHQHVKDHREAQEAAPTPARQSPLGRLVSQRALDSEDANHGEENQCR